MPKTDAKTGQFVKNNGGGPGRGKKAPLPATGEGLADDMHLAYTTAETPGERPGVTAARKLLREDYTKFVTLFARFSGGVMADAEVPPAVVEPVAAAATAGPKEQRVDELIDQLLQEWEAAGE